MNKLVLLIAASAVASGCATSQPLTALPPSMRRPRIRPCGAWRLTTGAWTVSTVGISAKDNIAGPRRVSIWIGKRRPDDQVINAVAVHTPRRRNGNATIVAVSHTVQPEASAAIQRRERKGLFKIIVTRRIPPKDHEA